MPFQVPTKHDNETPEEYVARIDQARDAHTASLHLISSHAVAVEGATTQRGGTIRVEKSSMLLHDKKVARVGDIAFYPDGTQATIINGAGEAMIEEDRMVAIVGSKLDNGDIITATAPNGLTLYNFAEEPIAGFLE